MSIPENSLFDESGIIKEEFMDDNLVMYKSAKARGDLVVWQDEFGQFSLYLYDDFFVLEDGYYNLSTGAFEALGISVGLNGNGMGIFATMSVKTISGSPQNPVLKQYDIIGYVASDSFNGGARYSYHTSCRVSSDQHGDIPYGTPHWSKSTIQSIYELLGD